MLIKGDVAIDDRGSVTFVNDFDFKDVKRFYMVQNHSKGFVRAWHGHQKEGKYILVVSGAIKLAWIELKLVNKEPYLISTNVLSAEKPAVQYIPPGYANGFKTLTDDTKVIFFSTSSLEESLDDDIRFPADKWPHVWEVEER